MIGNRHPNTTRDLGAPADWEPSEHGRCGHLAIIDIETQAGPAMQSVWEPTPEELRILVAGGKVVLTVVGTCHPPVALSAYLP